MSSTYLTRIELPTKLNYKIDYNRLRKTFILNANSLSKSSGRVADIICNIVQPCLPNSSLVIPVSNFYSLNFIKDLITFAYCSFCLIK